MENITVGEIALTLTFIVALIGSIKYLLNEINKQVDKTLKPINSKIDNLNKEITRKIDNLELNTIKADLVNLLTIAEKGKATDEQKQLIYELFDKYDKSGGNGYIHNKVDNLRKEGKL